jgi:MinD-like ATPase involved in chromosome partitioning or flagellar assembly
MSERQVEEHTDWQAASPWEAGAPGEEPGTPPSGQQAAEETVDWIPDWADARAGEHASGVDAEAGAVGGPGEEVPAPDLPEDTPDAGFGRRSLYEELGLSLDLYDGADPAGGGDDQTLARLLAEAKDVDFPLGDGTEQASSPFPPGSLGGDPLSFSYTGSYDQPATDFGTGDLQVADLAPAASVAAPSHSHARPSRAGHRASTLEPAATPTSANLTADRVLRQRRSAPSRGWRRAVLQATAGTVNLGPSPRELRERELHNRIRTPIHGCQRLAVISLKGGVGKTTTVAALGSMSATLRGDRVIAVDANPDRGTLGEKVVGDVRATVRDFVGRSPRLQRYADVREMTMQAPSRLEVLASESDPLASMAFSEQDYRVVSDVLERFYSLIITDCGTGLLHSAMVGVLAMADSIVVVSSASLDGARSASATLDWLEAHGYTALARDSVAVISAVRPQAGDVHLEEIEDHFAARCRSVVRVPYDPHLSAGGRIDLDQLRPRTYEAYLHLAAEVGDGFGRVPRH